MATPRTATLPERRQTRLAGAPPGPRKRAERSDSLLDSAAALFVTKGMAATSIDDIALHAGVAKGTFYHYFQDRAAMLEALQARYAQQFADATQAAIADCADDDWQGKLKAWVACVLREYLATYPLHDALFHEVEVRHRYAMSELPFVQVLTTTLAEGERQGAWRTGNPEMTAVCMFHALHGLVDEALVTGSDTAELAPYLSRLFLNMVTAR